MRQKSIDNNAEEAMTLSSDQVAYQSAVRHSMELMHKDRAAFDPQKQSEPHMQKGRLMMHGDVAANNGLRSPPSTQYDASNLG